MKPGPENPIVFLHIPKTAGQTIHNELAAWVGAPNVSPVRVHSQVRPDERQMPPGYALYSGHIDWTELDLLPPARLVLTVLRDPRERIASFYFFLLHEAQALSPQDLALHHNTGKQRILTAPAEAYFFGGDRGWQRFIRDHYDNFYCSYFATRKMRGLRLIEKLPEAEVIRRALAGLRAMDGVYDIGALDRLEDDFHARTGHRLHLTGNYRNAGQHAREQPRWPLLLARMDSDAGRRRLEDFVTRDLALLDALNRG